MDRRGLPDSVEHRQIALLLLLTAVSGAVDSVSYLGLGRVFTSNMTGNWVVLAFALTGEHVVDVLRLGFSFLGFLVGAVMAGQLARLRLRGDRQGWPAAVTAALMLSVGLQIAVMAIWLANSDGPPATFLAFLLAVSMGCQGGAVRELGVADLPTVVITSTVTGLTGDSFFGNGRSVRWRRRSGAVAAFFLGGLVGALIGREERAIGLVLSIALLAAVLLAVRSFFALPPDVRVDGELSVEQ
jgi:uncharacterized membrane protein YoaK (UPF0700 family)